MIRKSSFLALRTLIVPSLAWAVTASATSLTWTTSNPANTVWTAAGVWDGPATWANGDSATFVNSPTVNLGTAISQTGITVTPGHTLTLNLTADSKITGVGGFSGDLTKMGGYLRLSHSGGFNGTLRVNSNYLILGSAATDPTGQTSSSTKLVANGGGIIIGSAYNGLSLTIGELSGSSGSVRTDWADGGVNAKRTLIVDQSTDAIYSGTFNEGSSGRSFDLVKTGVGKLTLAGNSTGWSAGNAIITGGTLKLGHANAVGVNGSYAQGFALRNGALDINGQANFTFSGGSAAWLINNEAIVLGGQAGGVMVITNSGASAGFTLFASQNCINYDEANNPGTATIAAGWYGVGSSSATTKTITVGDSTGTAVELDFTGQMSQTAVADGSQTLIQKAGAGTMRISAANYFPRLQVSAGKLIVNHVNALGASRSSGYANLVTVDGGILDLNGFGPSIGGLADGGVSTGLIRNDGGSASVLTVGASGASTTYGGTIQDGASAVALTKTGAGTLTLNNANSYSGNTTIGAGTLALGASGSIANSSTITLASGSTFDVSAVSGGFALGGSQTFSGAGTVTGTFSASNGSTVTAIGGNLSMDGLTLGSTGSDAQTLNVSVGNSTSILAVSGALTANGITTLNVSGIGLVAGNTYHLVSYGGTAISSGFALGTLPNRVLGTLQYNTVEGVNYVDLYVSATDFPKWTGAIDGNWDTITANWTLNTGGGSAYYVDGTPGDAVLFDESLTGNPSVTVNTTVTPASVTVSNSSTAYSISGSGKISGAATTLTKAGSGTLALSTTGGNDYTGGTIVDGGELELADGGGASGAIRGMVTVSSGATLKLTDGDALGYNADSTVVQTLNLNGGTLNSAGGANQTTTADIVMTGGTISGTVNLDLYSPTAANNNASITTLASATPSTISVSSLNLRQDTVTFNVADGDAETDLAISSAIGDGSGGAHNLLKTGAGTMALSGDNTYTGATTISAGTLKVTQDTQVGCQIAGTAGTTFDFGANTVTLTLGPTLGGFNYGKLMGTGTILLRGGGNTLIGSNGVVENAINNFWVNILTTSNMPPSPFALDTGASPTDRKDFGFINDTSDVLTLSSLSGYGAIRTDAGGVSGQTTTRYIRVDQSGGDTSFHGALLSHRSTGSPNAVRALTFEKTGSSKLTLAGFIGKSTASAASGAAPVNLIANGGVLDVTNPYNTTSANADAINLGTVTVTSGTLAFADQALLNAAGDKGATSIEMNGGTLQWDSGNTQDITAGGKLTLVEGKTAIFDLNGNDVSFDTAFAGGAIAAGVTKTGSGTLTLNAVNIYTGTTTVNGGTLAGTGTVAGDLNVESGGTLAPGSSIGTFTAGGAVTVNLGGTIALEIKRAAGPVLTSDQIAGATSFSVAGALVVTLDGTSDPLVGGESFTMFNVQPAGTFSFVTLPSPLASGLNWFTPDNYATLEVNRAPTVSAFTLGVAAGGATTVNAGKFANDPDTDSVTVSAVTQQGASGTVTFSGSSLTYSNTASATSDSFQYVVSDGRGGTATNTVLVTITPAQGFNKISNLVNNNNGTYSLSYLGIPGESYALETASDLTPPISWTAIVTNMAATDGYLNFTFPTGDSQGYFRTRHVTP